MAGISDLDTRSRIKVSARRLFAERGVEAVTVREIVSEAGARNSGSLNYYFKSKDGLILDLLTEIFHESSEGWMEGLSRLEQAGGPNSARDVVALLVRWPDVSKFTDASPTASRFLNSVLSTRRLMLRTLLDRMNFSVYSRLLYYLRQLNVGMPDAVMQQRLIYLSWYLISIKAAHETHIAAGRKSAIWDDADPIENMIDCGTGLLEACLWNRDARLAINSQHTSSVSAPPCRQTRKRLP